MAEYIEREALIEKLQAHKDLFVKAWGSFRKMPEKDKARVDAITTCISDVMNATAADVVERKRGRWEFKIPNGWACTECGEWGLTIDNRGICKPNFCPNFCPNCGADMRSEGNNENQ